MSVFDFFVFKIIQKAVAGSSSKLDPKASRFIYLYIIEQKTWFSGENVNVTKSLMKM